MSSAKRLPAITAQIGVMRVTEEIDALSAMGVSRHQRLVLPKVIALILAMPLLVLWTSAAALAGGMLIAQLQLGIDALYFLEGLQRVVPVQNLYIGLSKHANERYLDRGVLGAGTLILLTVLYFRIFVFIVRY